MTQVERRILELDFDNKNFESSVRTSMDTIDQLQRKLEMRDAVDGINKVEKAANDISFRGMEAAVSDASDKFTAFEMSATDDIASVEKSANDFSVRGLLSGIADAALRFTGFRTSAGDDLSALQRAEETFTMRDMASALEEISNRFTTLGIIGMSVLNELTQTAMSAGATLASKILDPIVQGGKNRAFAIENAHFSLQGLISDEEEVQRIMQDALESVDGTAYAYNDAASAAAQFAATGLRSGEQMQTTLRGIAGVAATTNAEYSEISHIFTTVAGNGRLMTEQLNQFSYRGMNAAASLTKAFNDVLNGSSELSEEMQQHIKDLVTYGSENIKDFSGSLEGITEGDLRQLVSKGKIDFETFSSIMAMTFGEHAKDANKTFNGSMSNIRAALARTGAMFYQDLIRQEGPLVNFFNNIRQGVNAFNTALKPFAEFTTSSIESAVNYINAFLDRVNGLHVLDALSVPIKSFVSALKMIAGAFQDVFPALEEADFRRIAADIFSFLQSLTLTKDQLVTIKRIAEGFFSAFKIGGQVIVGIGKIFGSILQALAPLGAKIVELVAWIADMVTAFAKASDEMGIFDAIASGVGGVLSTLVNFIVGCVDVFQDLVKEVAEGVTSFKLFEKIGEKVSQVFDAISHAGEGTSGIFEAIKEKLSFLAPIFEKIGDAIRTVTDKIGSAFDEFIQTATLNDILDAINKVLVGGILVAIAGFINGLRQSAGELTEFFSDLGKIPSGIADLLKELFEVLKGGQEALNPKLLIEIAAAIAVLAASLYLVGQLDLPQIVAGLGGVAALMAEFAVFMKILPKVAGGLAGMKGMGKVAAELILLAVAIDIMASALVKLGKLEYEEIVKGLVGLFGTVGALVAAAKGIDKLSGNLRKVAGELILLAVALNMLVVPIKVLGGMDLRSLVKGLTGVVGAAASLALLGKVLDGVKVKPTTAVSLIGIATALSLMVLPIKLLGQMDLAGVVQGVAAIGVVMAELAAFTKFVNPSQMTTVGVSMIAIAASMEIFADAVRRFGSLDIGSLVSGIVAMGAVLAEVAVFTKFVDPAKMLSLSAGMVIMGAAMEILAHVVSQFGSMSVEELVKGLGSIAAALVIFAAACAVMKTALPGAAAILVCSAALIPLSVALSMLAAIPIPGLIAGLMAIAATFVIFGVAGAVLGPMTPVILALAAALLVMGAACLVAGVGIGVAATGLAAFVTAFAAGGAAIIAVVVELATQLPYIFQQIALSIVSFLETMAASVESLKESLLTIARAMLEVFVALIPEAVNATLQLVLGIVTALAENVPTIAQAMLDFIGGLLRAVADNIQTIVEAGISIVVNFVNGIANSLGSVIDAAFNLVISFINGLADAIRNNHVALFDAVGNLITAIVEAIIDGVSKVAEAAGNLIEGFFQGIEELDPIGKIGEIASNVVQGFIDGILDMLGSVADAASSLGEAALNGLKDLLGIASPSKAFSDAGEDSGQGYIEGLKAKLGDAESTSEGFGEDMLAAFLKNIGDAADAGVKMTTDLLNGVTSNQSEYGNTGNTFGSNFVDNFKKLFPNAMQAGITITTNAINGLKSNFNEYGSTGTSESNSFVDQVRNKFGNAMQAGITVTTNAVNGLKSNFGEYGNTGTSESNSFVDQVRNKFGNALQAGITVTTNAVNGLKSNFGEYGNTGTSESNSFVDQVRNKFNAAWAAGSLVTGNAVSGLKSNFGEYYSTGDSAGSNYVGGLGAGNYHGAYSQGSNMASEGKSGANWANDHAGGYSWTNVGSWAGEGYYNGVGSWISSIIERARELVRRAKEAAKAEQDSSSPSKEFKKLGIWAGQGYDLGMESQIPVVAKTSTELASTAIEAAKDAISKMSKLDYDLLDSMEPVITPVVDMTNIDAAKRDIQDVFRKANVFADMDAAVQGIASMTSGGTTETGSNTPKAGTVINQTFNQTNNSPKALSNADIYRKTKSMFALARGPEAVLTND